MSDSDYQAVHARGGPLEPGLSDEQEEAAVWRRRQINRAYDLIVELSRSDYSRDVVLSLLDEMLDALD